MKKKLLTGLVGGLVMLSVGSAIAQPYQPPPPGPRYEGQRMERPRQAYRIQHRIDAQEREIRRGLRSGSLTRGEARMLRDNLNHIKREYRRAQRTDRYVSMEERARIDNMLDRNGRMIRRMETNGISRF